MKSLLDPDMEGRFNLSISIYKLAWTSLWWKCLDFWLRVVHHSCSKTIFYFTCFIILISSSCSYVRSVALSSLYFISLWNVLLSLITSIETFTSETAKEFTFDTIHLHYSFDLLHFSNIFETIFVLKDGTYISRWLILRNLILISFIEN